MTIPAGLGDDHLRAQLVEPPPEFFILQFYWDIFTRPGGPSYAAQAWDY